MDYCVYLCYTRHTYFMWKVNKRQKKFTREPVVETLTHTHNTWLSTARSCGKLMFSQMSVCPLGDGSLWFNVLSRGGGRYPGDGYSSPGWVCLRMGTLDTLDMRYYGICVLSVLLKCFLVFTCLY